MDQDGKSCGPNARRCPDQISPSIDQKSHITGRSKARVAAHEATAKKEKQLQPFLLPHDVVFIAELSRLQSKETATNTRKEEVLEDTQGDGPVEKSSFQGTEKNNDTVAPACARASPARV